MNAQAAVAGVLRLGLTGGIGSGKSTVAQMLVDEGAALVDADACSRAATAAGGAAIAPIREAFGADFIGADGALDRERMRELVFREPGAKRTLESIVHPLVGAAIAAQASDAIRRGHRVVVFDVPLLVESGRWRQQVDRVLVVDCSPDTQVARVMARNGLQRAAVEAIIASQAPRAQRLAAADCVVCNDGLSLDELRTQVRSVWQHLMQASGAAVTATATAAR